MTRRFLPLPEPQRDRFRAQHIGYVFQTFNLLAAFSALENVMLAMLFTHAIPSASSVSVLVSSYLGSA